MHIPDTHYARTPDGVYIAYQTVGDGPVDLVWQFDFTGNVDVVWETKPMEHWLEGLASFSRLILHDRRGTGLSSRNVPLGDLETRVADLRVVLDTVGSETAVLSGFSAGGAPNALLAAAEPDRVRSLVWVAPAARSLWAPDYPWGVSPEYVERSRRGIEEHWGSDAFGRDFIETERVAGHDVSEEFARGMGKRSRHTGTPDVAVELERIWYETDIRGVLPSVRVPALLMDVAEPDHLEESRYVASLMPDARLVLIPGDSEDAPEVQDAQLISIREFVGIAPEPTGLDTILSTVLFTDIVGSTEKQASLGDHGWKGLVERHHAVVRDSLARWHGVENDTAGDGFYATFDGPARAIRCAREVTERVRDLGIEIRAGVHTGECELIDDKVGGITVSIGARVASTAGPSEVLVSQTVKDLVAGSGLTFEDAGEHELKGVPDRWHLYRVVS